MLSAWDKFKEKEKGSVSETCDDVYGNNSIERLKDNLMGIFIESKFIQTIVWITRIIEFNLKSYANTIFVQNIGIKTPLEVIKC